MLQNQNYNLSVLGKATSTRFQGLSSVERPWERGWSSVIRRESQTQLSIGRRTESIFLPPRKCHPNPHEIARKFYWWSAPSDQIILSSERLWLSCSVVSLPSTVDEHQTSNCGISSSHSSDLKPPVAFWGLGHTICFISAAFLGDIFQFVVKFLTMFANVKQNRTRYLPFVFR